MFMAYRYPVKMISTEKNSNKDECKKIVPRDLIPFHSFTLFTHTPFLLMYAFYAYPFPPHLRILLHNFFQHKYWGIKS